MAMTTTTRRPTLLALAAVVATLLLLAAPAPASGQPGPGVVGGAMSCTASLVTSFTPCLNFIANGSASPTDDCCRSLGALMRASTGCACLILTGSVSIGVPINRTLAGRQAAQGVQLHLSPAAVPRRVLSSEPSSRPRRRCACALYHVHGPVATTSDGGGSAGARRSTGASDAHGRAAGQPGADEADGCARRLLLDSKLGRASDGWVICTAACSRSCAQDLM